MERGFDFLFAHLMAFDSPYNASFMDFVNENFNIEEHIFIVLSSSQNFKHISPKYQNVNFVNMHCWEDYTYIHTLLDESQKIFIHFLDISISKIIANYYNIYNNSIIWILWGGDIQTYLNEELFSDLTRSFTSENYIKSFEINDVPVESIQALKKISFFGCGSASDRYSQIMNKKFSLDIKNAKLMYYNPVPFDIVDNIEISPDLNFKKNYKYMFMVGHSATPILNHFDIIKKLSEINRNDFCIICPLSYGNEGYAEKVSQYGNDLLRERFIVLRNFLPPSQYAYVLSQVDVFILNSYRSIAFSNIQLFLYLGKKIFINDKNHSMISLFNEWDLKIQLLEKDYSGFFDELDTETKQHNAKIIQQMCSKEAAINNWKNIFYEL